MSEAAKQDLQKAAQAVQDKVNDGVKDIKDVKPEQWGVAGSLSLILSLLLHVITKQKEDNFLTFGVIIYAIVITFLSIFLRNQQLNSQFTTMIVMLSFFRCFFDIAPSSLIILSFLPFAVNTVYAELKARGIIKA